MLDLEEHVDVGRQVAETLHHEFNDGHGVFGHARDMPEKTAVSGIDDAYDRLMLITLCVSIDYDRDADRLWRNGRGTYDDEETRWLYSPEHVTNASLTDVESALKKHFSLRYPNKDVWYWKKNAETFQQEFDGDPREMMREFDWDAMRLYDGLRGRYSSMFMGLSGYKISRLWIRMLKDVLDYDLDNFHKLPIPVDTHIARASFTTGLLTGTYTGKFNTAFKDTITTAWFNALAEADVSPIMIDEPLWHLSKHGCLARQRKGNGRRCPEMDRCSVRDYCVNGTVSISQQGITIQTRRQD